MFNLVRSLRAVFGVCSTPWWICCRRWWWVSRTLCAASNPTTTGRRCVSARRGWWCSCATQGSWRRWTSAARASPTASPLKSLSTGTDLVWTGNTEPCSERRCCAVGALPPVPLAPYPRSQRWAVFTGVCSLCWWKCGISATHFGRSDGCRRGVCRGKLHTRVWGQQRETQAWSLWLWKTFQHL